MLLESRLNERTTIVIDAETVGGIDKGALSTFTHPDKALPSAVALIRAVSESMSDAIAADAKAPNEMEVAFTVRVDSNAVVSIARAPEAGQFRVTMRWRK